jgi:hypothetical protein
MSAVQSNFLKLAFSAYEARTNLRDGFLATSHLLCYFQEVNIRKIGPVKRDGVFLLEDREVGRQAASPIRSWGAATRSAQGCRI